MNNYLIKHGSRGGVKGRKLAERKIFGMGYTFWMGTIERLTRTRHGEARQECRASGQLL